jgi:hypothetical protein
VKTLGIEEVCPIAREIMIRSAEFRAGCYRNWQVVMSNNVTTTHEQLEHSHTREQIQQRLARDPHGSYLRDWIYGGIDGTITTFAIVAGVVGADLSGSVVLVLGLANLVADGFAMGAGNYCRRIASVKGFSASPTTPNIWRTPISVRVSTSSSATVWLMAPSL